MTYAEATGLTIRERAAAAGLSMREVARRSGVRHQTIALWHAGTRDAEPTMPSLRLLLAVAEVLGTTPAALLADAERMMAADEVTP
jgi:transcriptional regulator with XRE-family HTH domain